MVLENGAAPRLAGVGRRSSVTMRECRTIILPSLGLIDRVSQAQRDDWHLDDARATTGYSPSYARTMHELPSQLARFRRGDSTLIVAAWDARRDTTLIGRSLDAALVIWSDDSSRASSGGRRTRDRDDGGGGGRGFRTDELGASGQGGSTRRENPHGLSRRDSSRVALSDLLLYTPTVASADALESVQDNAFTSDGHSAVARARRLLGDVWAATRGRGG